MTFKFFPFGTPTTSSFALSVVGTTFTASTAVNSGSGFLTASYALAGFTGPTGPASSLAASNYVAVGILNADQSIPNGSDTLIAFVDYVDPQNWWDPTAKQFKPNVAGYYEVAIQTWFASGTTATGQYNTQVRVNGVQSVIYQNQITTSVGVTQGGSEIIYLNGSTDYVEMYTYLGAARTLNGGSDQTWFSGALVRSA